MAGSPQTNRENICDRDADYTSEYNKTLFTNYNIKIDNIHSI